MGTRYVRQRRTQTNLTVVCGLKLRWAFERLFVWLTITIASISCAIVQTLARRCKLIYCV